MAVQRFRDGIGQQAEFFEQLFRCVNTQFFQRR
jgi:hypothetical protein